MFIISCIRKYVKRCLSYDIWNNNQANDFFFSENIFPVVIFDEEARARNQLYMVFWNTLWRSLWYNHCCFFMPPRRRVGGGGILIYPCPSVRSSRYRYMVCPAISSYSFGATALIFCRMCIHIMEVCMSTGFWFSSNILKMTGSWT